MDLLHHASNGGGGQRFRLRQDMVAARREGDPRLEGLDLARPHWQSDVKGNFWSLVGAARERPTSALSPSPPRTNPRVSTLPTKPI